MQQKKFDSARLEPYDCSDESIVASALLEGNHGSLRTDAPVGRTRNTEDLVIG